LNTRAAAGTLPKVVKRAGIADGTAKPVIFVSCSHNDEPGPPAPLADRWLSYVMSFLQPAKKRGGIFDLWSDQDIPGGAEWEQHIRARLAECNICILLVSRHSLDSDYCIKIEVEEIRRRQQRWRKCFHLSDHSHSGP
jgi:TIR domain